MNPNSQVLNFKEFYKIEGFSQGYPGDMFQDNSRMIHILRRCTCCKKIWSIVYDEEKKEKKDL